MTGVPPTFGNGSGKPQVPPDLVWDDDNPPKIFPCSLDTQHEKGCRGQEQSIVLESRLQVEVLNEGRAWARAGMNFQGVPAAYQGVIPVTGINVELVDMLMWLEAMKELLLEISDISEFDIQERFRAKKLEFLQAIRNANEEKVKSQRIRNQIGLAQKGIIGPDGRRLT